MTGTIKLHGTHADLLVYPSGSGLEVDGKVVCHSRNRTELTVESDNQGFAPFCSTRKAAIRRLTQRVRERWRKLHPDAEIGDEPVILAGEWIGAGIQKNVAISRLSKRWVICSLKVAGTWEPLERYADIEDSDAGLVNVSRGGFYHLQYRYQDEGQAFLEKAKNLTVDIRTSCPFGKTFGVSGAGEGLVWTSSTSSGHPPPPLPSPIF